MKIHHPDVRTMVAWGAEFTSRAILNRRPQWLVLSGGTGCGKTLLAKRALRVIRETSLDAYNAGLWGDRGRTCTTAQADWPRLVEITDDADYEDAARDLREADVVLLDDVGAETDRFKSGAPASRLRRLLSDLEHKWVLITTNLLPTQFMGRWDARVASRLSAAHVFNASNIPDYRAIQPKS